MNFLLSPIPLLCRIAAVALAFAVAIGFGYVKGAEHGQARIDAMVAKQATEAVKVIKGQDIVTTTVQTKYLPQITRHEVVTETILKEIPTYVQAADPPLPGRFRVLHDAAAEGAVPDAARIPDAAPVPAEEADRTIVANYGTCLADQTRLAGLQEWIAGQLKLNGAQAP